MLGRSTPTKIAHDQWIELSTCPDRGGLGTIHLSQPERRFYDVSADAIRQASKSFASNLAKAFTVRPAIFQLMSIVSMRLRELSLWSVAWRCQN